MVPVSVSSLGSFADDLDSIQPAQKIDANSTTTRHFIYSYSSLIISEWLPIAATCHDGEYDMASVENQISSLKLACFFDAVGFVAFGCGPAEMTPWQEGLESGSVHRELPAGLTSSHARLGIIPPLNLLHQEFTKKGR